MGSSTLTSSPRFPDPDGPVFGQVAEFVAQTAHGEPAPAIEDLGLSLGDALSTLDDRFGLLAGRPHNMTKVRAAAFLRTGTQVANKRKAQLEILKLKIAKRHHGLDPKTLELVTALLQPQSYYQQLKADDARKLRQIQMFGPGMSISAPGQAAAPLA